MTKLLLSLALYAAAAHGALLTPSFGPGSYVMLGPEVNHGIGHSPNCFVQSPCLAADGSGRDLSVIPVFDSIEWFIQTVYARIESGSLIVEAITEIFTAITCYEPCPDPFPSDRLPGLFGGSSWSINLMVQSPAQGHVSYDHYINGELVGRIVQEVNQGVVPLAQISGSLPFNLARSTPGVTHEFLTQTEEVRNIVWIPEPGSLWLVGVALAGLPVFRFHQVRRRSRRKLNADR